MLNILVVEDNHSILELIELNLARRGYNCDTASDGQQAANLIETNHYDLILLDIMLPEIDGYELLAYIEPLHIPVIFITAKGSLRDRVRGLHLGADDYIVKPFEMEELVARVEAVLRRAGKGNTLLTLEDVEIDLIARTVKKQGKMINLTMKEFDLLVTLAQNKNIVLYRPYLFEKIWGEDWEDDTRTIDLHVQRLRKKMDWSDKIKTIYRLGYKLEVES